MDYCQPLLAGFISENIAKGGQTDHRKSWGGGGGGGGGGGLNSAWQCVLLVGSGFEISKGGTIFIGVTGSSQALSDTVVKRFVACCLLCKTCAHHGLREDGAPASAYLRAAPDCMQPHFCQTRQRRHI